MARRQAGADPSAPVTVRYGDFTGDFGLGDTRFVRFTDGLATVAPADVDGLVASGCVVVDAAAPVATPDPAPVVDATPDAEV